MELKKKLEDCLKEKQMEFVKMFDSDDEETEEGEMEEGFSKK